MSPAISLSTYEISRFNVKNILNNFRGGQKNVFIIEDNNGDFYALKHIQGSLNARTSREVNFYKTHEDLDGIPRIVDLDTSQAGHTYILEEYIPGDPLSQLMQNYRNNSGLILELLQKIHDIMFPIWNEERIHRDIKPDNIIIKSNGDPVVIDFGILKSIGDPTITQVGFQPRSIPFVSPEQIEGNKNKISYRTDLFCIGVIGYVLYTDSYPFGKDEDTITRSYSKGELGWQKTGDTTLDEKLSLVFKKNPSDRARTISFTN